MLHAEIINAELRPQRFIRVIPTYLLTYSLPAHATAQHESCLPSGQLLPIVATTSAHLHMALSTLVDEHWHHIVATLARVPPTNAPIALVLADMIVSKVIGHSSNSTRSLIVARVSSDDHFSSFDEALFVELRASASSPASIAYIAELVSADAFGRNGQLQSSERRERRGLTSCGCSLSPKPPFSHTRCIVASLLSAPTQAHSAFLGLRDNLYPYEQHSCRSCK